MIRVIVGVALLSSAFLDSPVRADSAKFAGSWKTTFGVVTLKADGDSVEGTFGPGGQSKIQGKVTDKVLKATYKEPQAEGELTFTLDESGNTYTGRFQLKNGRAGIWNGWRPDPEAAKATKRGDFSGLWLTNLGLMDLKQDGAKVTGKYALRGGSTLEGTITGRHLEFRYKAFGAGPAWFDLSEDGKFITGASGPDGPGGWNGWKGRRSPEYRHHVPLAAGKMIDGSTDNLLTYTVRAPESYKTGDNKKWPAILVLHGSNMNGTAYVNTLAAAWPDIAKDYIIVGINGEMPSNTAVENPQFNYSYVNFVGKSTFRGFPGTDRESPALVSEAMKELKDVYPIKHYFVGGHSQGGFLTYSLLMNYPESLAGAFPISCGLIFQCEPSAYADEAIKKAQRTVPLAIIHGKNDPVVSFGMGDYAARVFGEANWPAYRFFTDPQAAHMFARLPVSSAIRWLEALNSDDPKRLAQFAENQIKDGDWRSAIAAVRRANDLKVTDDGIKKTATEIDAKAGPDAKKFVDLIAKNVDATWVDGFLTFRDQFEFADAAKEAMSAFNKLRAQQTEPAQKLMNEARGLFQQGKRDQGYAKYQEIADKYYAAPTYRDVKKALAEKK